MDRGAVGQAVAAAIETMRVDLAVDEAVQAICGNDMRLVTAFPLSSAKALATTWLHQTQWRAEDPRARVLLVTATGKAAANLRSAGFAATTAFAHARSEDPYGYGLVIGIGMSEVEAEHTRRLVDVPAHVRIILLEDAETIARTLPPVAPAERLF